MANDKIYPIDMGTKDILLQNEGGGGMIMNDQFIGIVGNMLPNQKELLDGQDNVNGTNIQTDKFSSNIIITNASSNPVGMSDLASKNFDSLDQSIGTEQVVTPTANNNCGGEAFLNYEFQEAAKNFALFNELWGNGGDPNVEPYSFHMVLHPEDYIGKGINKYIKSQTQIESLLFSPIAVKEFFQGIVYDNKNFNCLVTKQYGVGTNTLQDATKILYSDYWIRAEKNDLGKITDKNGLFLNNNTNKKETKSVFDIQTLPSGLRTMAFYCSQTINPIINWIWIINILETIGPDGLDILKGLGIASWDTTHGIRVNKNIELETQLYPNPNPNDPSQNYFRRNSNEYFDEMTKKFYKEYEDIINAYNQDKPKFLTELSKKILNSLEYNIKEDDFKDDLAPIYTTYDKISVNIALQLALKYADCPNEFELEQTITSTTNPISAPTPTPTVTAASSSSTTPPPTKAEEEEGIYNAEFLPASDDPGAALFDGDYGDTCSAAVEKAKNDISNKRFDSKDLKNFGGGLPPDFSNIDLVKELDTYIQFSTQARDDYDNGIINPNTILDLLRIGKGAKIKIYVSTARKGHSCETTSGNLSRHMKGYGLDLGGFYDLNGVIAASNKMITSSASTASGVPANFKTIADNFVSTAMQLSGAGRSEGVIQRGILWYFNEKAKGGNHFNHVHYSNKENYSGWTPKTIPSSFNCDCAKVRSSGLTAENC